MTRRLFLSAAVMSPVLAARSWDSPAFPDWPQEFIDKLITDSPWARPLTVTYLIEPADDKPISQNRFMQIGFPGGGTGGLGLPRIPGIPGTRTSGPGSTGRSPFPTGGDNRPVKSKQELIVRWSTALPIRQALALNDSGASNLKSESAQAILKPNTDEYVIEICGFTSASAPRGTKRLEEELVQTARLNFPGRKSLSPVDSSVPQHGQFHVATLHFPRLNNITADDGTVELTATAGSIKIQQQFKLKSMVYQGELAL